VYIVSETIRVSKETKEALVRVAARLQESTGKRVDLDAAIAHLVTNEDKDPRAFARFAGSIKGIGADELLKVLAEERRADELRFKRKYSP
jgi:hypothetical protein